MTLKYNYYLTTAEHCHASSMGCFVPWTQTGRGRHRYVYVYHLGLLYRQQNLLQLQGMDSQTFERTLPPEYEGSDGVLKGGNHDKGEFEILTPQISAMYLSETDRRRKNSTKRPKKQNP